MKKKILFMVINMNIGGTEKALLNMIAAMPKEKYDITILMLEEYGGFLNAIPEDVHIEYVKGYNGFKDILNKPPREVALHFLRQGKVIKAFNLINIHLLSKVLNDRRAFFKYILKNHPIADIEYDVAVAYAGPMDFISFFIAEKIKARRKVQWIHFDITRVGFNRSFASKIYGEFDKLFVVSDGGKEKVTNILPHLKGKTERFLNIISPELITEMADKNPGFDDKFCGTRILTVGRLSIEKGQDLTIAVLAKLKEAGYNVKWYCIGDGGAREEYEKLIKKHNVENDYILLGATPNPYPYMKQCDMYVQSSRHEGYCITLAEAKCFDNPIVSTNFTGASEQIANGQTGLIVNFDELQMFNAIKNLLDDKSLKYKLRSNLRNEIVNTANEMDKFYNIADSLS
ncbi:MAG TPA: glycosyltransferase [Bacillales bacterium]|nr:glycosyltransferase [Bacillales bacterium]